MLVPNLNKWEGHIRKGIPSKICANQTCGPICYDDPLGKKYLLYFMVLHGERKKEFGESWLIWNFATLDVFVCFYELNGVVIIRPAGDSSRYCCWWGNWSNCMFYMVLPRIYHKYFHCMPGNMSLLLKVSTDVPVKSPFFTCSKYSHRQKKNNYILETITVHSLFNLLFPRNIKLRNKPESCPPLCAR